MLKLRFPAASQLQPKSRMRPLELAITMLQAGLTATKMGMQRAGREGSEQSAHSLCDLFGIIQQICVDGVDVLARDGHLGEELLVVESEVGVFVVQRDETLVCKEDLPVDGGMDGLCDVCSISAYSLSILLSCTQSLTICSTGPCRCRRGALPAWQQAIRPRWPA